jgi:hypothetical protein
MSDKYKNTEDCQNFVTQAFSSVRVIRRDCTLDKASLKRGLSFG